MVNDRAPVRRPLRFEVRVSGMYRTGAPFNISRSRSAKIDAAMLAVLDIGRAWVANPDDVSPATTVRLVDLNDGATIMLLHWNGFDPQELETALEVLRDNGFTLEEVTKHGQQQNS